MSWRAIAVLAVILAGLIGAERRLRGERARGGPALAELAPLVRPGVGRLVSAKGQTTQIAALTVTPGIAEGLFMARVSGLWRAINHFGALGDESAMVAILEQILDARAVVEAELEDAGEARLRPFGLDSLQRLRVDLHGTGVDPKTRSGDVLLRLDLGHALGQGRGTFARVVDLAGTAGGPVRVLSIDVDLRALLERRAAPDLPPLVDGGVIGRGWPGFQSNIAEVEFESADALYRLIYDPPAGPDQPGSWRTHVPGRGSAPATGEFALAYVMFLARVQAQSVRDPREVDPEQVRAPQARARILAADGSAVELLLLEGAGPEAPAGGARTIISSYGGVGLAVEPDAARLLFPGVEVFEQEMSGATPWDAFLQR